MPKPKILFICTHNSARSQLAEGLLRSIYGDKYESYSAGTNPSKINPLAIKAMAEIGIDISKQYSKSLDEFSDTEIDLAVAVCQSSTKTLCAFCSSPITMGRPLVINAKLHKTKNYIVHGFEDPQKLKAQKKKSLTSFAE